MFILKAVEMNYIDFYTGKTFISNGECYPCVSSNPNDAKKYTSEARAKNASDKLCEKVGRHFAIVPYDGK